MTRLEFTVTVLTPAFLGDAEQHGRWRDAQTTVTPRT
jgi:hypothetical protein